MMIVDPYGLSMKRLSLKCFCVKRHQDLKWKLFAINLVRLMATVKEREFTG